MTSPRCPAHLLLFLSQQAVQALRVELFLLLFLMAGVQAGAEGQWVQRLRPPAAHLAGLRLRLVDGRSLGVHLQTKPDVTESTQNRSDTVGIRGNRPASGTTWASSRWSPAASSLKNKV